MGKNKRKVHNIKDITILKIENRKFSKNFIKLVIVFVCFPLHRLHQLYVNFCISSRAIQIQVLKKLYGNFQSAVR